MPKDLLSIIKTIDSLPMPARASILILSIIIEYIFPFFPGDTVIIAAGFFSVHGEITLWEIICSLIIGTSIGIWINYYAGRFIVNNDLNSPKINKFIPSEKIVKINQWYQKWGYGLLIINRFFPGIRSLFFVAAGMSKMPFFPVLLSGLFSGLLFNAGLLALGYSIGYNFETLNEIWHHYTTASIIIIGIIAIGFLAFFFHRKRNS